MARSTSLDSLKRQIATERAKFSMASERIRLERELKQLKRSGKTDVAARIGRGFVILSKKTGKVTLKLGKKVGKATLKQAQLMRAQQIREAKRTRKRGRGGLAGMDNIFAPLDF